MPDHRTRPVTILLLALGCSPKPEAPKPSSVEVAIDRVEVTTPAHGGAAAYSVTLQSNEPLKAKPGEERTFEIQVAPQRIRDKPTEVVMELTRKDVIWDTVYAIPRDADSLEGPFIYKATLVIGPHVKPGRYEVRALVIHSTTSVAEGHEARRAQLDRCYSKPVDLEIP